MHQIQGLYSGSSNTFSTDYVLYNKSYSSVPSVLHHQRTVFAVLNFGIVVPYKAVQTVSHGKNSKNGKVCDGENQGKMKKAAKSISKNKLNRRGLTRIEANDSRARAFRLSPPVKSATEISGIFSAKSERHCPNIFTAFPRPSPIFSPECPPSKPALRKKNC